MTAAPPRLRSLSTRLVALTALLILSTVSVVVWQWAKSEREQITHERRRAAIGLATTIGHSMMNEIDDANWSQIRVDLTLLMKDDEDIVYVVIHGLEHGANQRIVAAAPPELNEQFFPDLVAASVTRAARDTHNGVLVAEPYLLRDVTLGEQRELRGTKGERIVEVAAPIKNASGKKIGTVRVGVSLAAVEAAVASAVRKAIAIGALALVFALAGALLVARRLSRTIRRLAYDAAKLASGNLSHRATVDRSDEIGALATAFNAMSTDLERNFNKLNQTLATFEQFVPRKFLAVVAPEGIENIVVGTAQPRRISVLFSDLRGFTSFSEGLQPIEVFHLLNDYLARMGGAITASGGFVDKYIGDAIMALFDDEHTDAVLSAILAMRAALRALNTERAAKNLPRIDAGIGAHGGEVVMGTIGFAGKIESTVIGDAVNVASRVEGMTKDHGVQILITGELVNRLRDRDAFPLRAVATGLKVRGRDEPIDLYTLHDEAAPPRA